MNQPSEPPAVVRELGGMDEELVTVLVFSLTAFLM